MSIVVLAIHPKIENSQFCPSAPVCLQADADATVIPAKPIRQKGMKFMSKRFQRGSVVAIKKMWVGRYRSDESVEGRRRQSSVVLGTRKEMTKQEAKRKLDCIIKAQGLNQSDYLERLAVPKAPVLTFQDVADAWMTKKLPLLRVSTQYSAPQQIAKHITPFFGEMALETIKTGTVNGWIEGLLKRGLEPKTVHNQWKQFRSIMNWHARQNDEPKRTWYPDLPVIPEDEQRWFTQGEIRRIVAEATGQYKPLFQLAGFSGLRCGEIIGLHVEDIDFTNGVVRVRRSVWRGIEVPVKTKKGFREVAIDSTTLRILKEYLGGRTTGRVFQTKNGTPLENHNIVRQVLKPICKRLGIMPGGMHAFRHGRVSHLQMNHVPGDFTKNQVGHSTLRTTSLYTHFPESFVRDTVERLAEADAPN